MRRKKCRKKCLKFVSSHGIRLADNSFADLSRSNDGLPDLSSLQKTLTIVKVVNDTDQTTGNSSRNHRRSRMSRRITTNAHSKDAPLKEKTARAKCSHGYSCTLSAVFHGNKPREEYSSL